MYDAFDELAEEYEVSKLDVEFAFREVLEDFLIPLAFCCKAKV